MALNLIPLAMRFAPLAARAAGVSKGIKGLGTVRAVLRPGQFGGAYDPAEDALTVYFPTGGSREYYGVPLVLATTWALSPSGTVYNYQIRGKYPSLQTS